MVNWEETTLGEICDIYDGTHQTPNYIEYGIPFYSVENVTNNNFTVTKYISAEEHKRLTVKYKILYGDILMTRIGSIGVCKYVDWAVNASFYVSLALLKCKSCIDARFLCFLSQGNEFKKEILTHSLQYAIPQKINLGNISLVRISIPPLPEQRRIAAVLSDTDELITALEKLIAKKRNIKKGAMQELLTGKMRLPGFSGEWETKQLGKIALDIKTGKRNNEDKVNNGKYPFFVRSQQIEHINDYSYDCEAILVPGEGNIGQIFHYINGKFDCHQRVYKISSFIDVDAKFIFYYLKMFFGQYALMNTVKATVDSLRLPTFINYEIRIPSTITEQTAIATILSDMDAEIDALKAKLNKLKHIKQGMMSELLTGRIRLTGEAEPQ